MNPTLPSYSGERHVQHTSVPLHQGHGSYPVGVATTQYVYAYQSGTIVYSNYNSRQSKISGVAQIVVGVLLMIFNATVIGLKPNGIGPVSHGFWGGITFIITGSFGIAAASYKTKCSTVAYIVLCIVSACLSAVVISVGAIGIALRVDDCYKNYGYYCMNGPEAIISMHAVITFLGLCEGCVAIWGSTLFCKAAGCCAANNTTVAPVQFIPNGAQMIIIGHPSQANTYPGFLMNAGLAEMAPPYQSTEDLRVNTGTENVEKQHLVDV